MASTKPLNIRVSELCETYLERESKLHRRSRGEIVRQLTDEAIKARMFPGLAFRGPDDDRRPWVVGTGLDVWQVIEAYREYGSADKLVKASDSLDQQTVKLALAYFKRFPEEIEIAIEQNNLGVDELLAINPLAEIFTTPTG